MAPKELFIFFVFAFLCYHFWRSHGVREIALNATKRYCHTHEITFLDESIALRALWCKRDKRGQLRAWRRWQFEFTVTGGERYLGQVITLGNVVEAFNVPPHRFAPPDDTLH